MPRVVSRPKSLECASECSNALGGSQMELDFLVGSLSPLATGWIISTRIAGTMFVFIALTAHLP